MSQSERKAKIDSAHKLPITRQCQLVSISRSSAYYQAKEPDDEALGLMRCQSACKSIHPSASKTVQVNSSIFAAFS